jgi:hypothetical protein
MKRDGARNCMNLTHIHGTLRASTRNAAKLLDKYVVLEVTAVLLGSSTLYARRRALRAWACLKLQYLCARLRIDLSILRTAIADHPVGQYEGHKIKEPGRIPLSCSL